MTLGISDPIRITDDAGNGAPNVVLTVTAPGYPGSTVVTDARGMTQLVDLPLGLYTITNLATGRSFNGVPVVQKPAEQEVTISKAAAAAVIGPASITVAQLAFDPATQNELDNAIGALNATLAGLITQIGTLSSGLADKVSLSTSSAQTVQGVVNFPAGVTIGGEDPAQVYQRSGALVATLKSNDFVQIVPGSSPPQDTTKFWAKPVGT